MLSCSSRTAGRQSCGDGVAVDEQLLGQRHGPRRGAARRPGLADERLVARRCLLEERVDRRKHVVGFDDHEGRPAAEGQVLEDRGFQPQVRGRRVVGLAQAFADGHDTGLIDGPGRTLRRRVVAADRLDRVADELDAQRLGVARREHVHDAAAHAELTVLVDRVLAREAGLEQLLGEQLGSDLDAGSQVHRRRGELSGRHQPRQQRGSRDHDEARLAGHDFGQGTRAGRGDLQMRRQAPIGIDLVTGQRHDRVGDGNLAQPLESVEEVPRVRRQLVDVGVGRHDDDGQVFRSGVGAQGHVQAASRRGQARQRAAGRVQASLRGGGTKERAESERTRG